MKIKKFENLGVEAQIDKVGDLPILHFKKNAEPFSLNLIFDFGAFSENKIGSAHYLEHVLLSGTEKYDNKKKIAEEFEKNGCAFEAWTSYFNLWVKEFNNTAADINFSVLMMEQMVLHPTFSEFVVETERSVILNEVNKTGNDKTRMSRNIFLQTLFPNTRLSLDVKGNTESVKNLNKSDLLVDYRHFLDSKKVLVTGGDFDVKIIKEKFGGLSRELVLKEESCFPKKVKSCKGRFAVKHSLGVSGVGMFFERAIYGDKNKRAIFLFINNLLFDKNGLIIEKLRYKNGLTYRVMDESLSNNTVDCFGVSAELTKNNEEKAISLIEEVLFNEIYQHLNKDSLCKYTSAMRLRERRNYRTTDHFIDKYAGSFLDFGENMVWHNEYLSILDSINVEEVIEEVRRVFRKENQSIIIFE